ncbi:hypothetical protein JCM8547_007506 [Rhodosporidiobolus lusitaniae]
MVISAPLPSTALSNHPLSLSLSLSSLAAPPLSLSSAALSLDCFDQYDDDRDSWTVQDDYDQPVSPSSPPLPSCSAKSPSPLSSALSDSTPLLFPHVSLAEEAALASAQGPADGGSEGGLPGWLKETSGRVTALESGRVRNSRAGRREGREGGGKGGGRKKSELRVAAGCEDGTVWIFAPPPFASSNSSEPEADGIGAEDALDARRLSHDSLVPSSSRSSSAPTSLPASPSSRSRRNFTSTLPTSSSSSSQPPRLRTHHSSTSLSSFASQSTTTSRTPRLPSSPPTSPTPSSSAGLCGPGISYELIRSASRPRKASATVSVSTSSAVPSSGPHSHELPDLPLSPTTGGGGPSSPPLSSPTVPSFVFSSPFSPSGPPSQNILGSKKESTHSHSNSASLSDGRVPGLGHGRKHSKSKARESIASGIGLWETSEGGGSPISTTPSAFCSAASLPASAEVEQEEDEMEQQEEGEEELKELVPVLKIRTKGWGEVVALRMVSEGDVEGVEEEGTVLLALRGSGHLSLISLLDGRCFASCNVSAKLPSCSTSGGCVSFSGLQVEAVGSDVYAYCTSSSSSSAWVVPVKLDSFVALDPLISEGGIGEAGAVVVKDGDSPYLLIAFPSSADNHSTPSFSISRISSSPGSDSSPSSLSLEPSQPLGSLPGLTGPCKTLQKCGENVLAVDASSLCLFTVRNAPLVPLGTFDSPSSILNVKTDEKGETVAVSGKDVKTRMYSLSKADEGFSFDLLSEHASSILENLTFLPSSSSSSPTSQPALLAARRIEGGERVLELLPSSPSSPAVELYHSRGPLETDDPRATCVKLLPQTNQVLVGFSSGSISLLPLSALSPSSSSPVLATAELLGAITLLDVIQFGGREVVVAGTASGVAGAWGLSDWDLLGSWTLFASPVKSFTYLSSSASSTSSSPASALPQQLSNSLAFISANSPIALVSLFPPSLLFVLPGTKSGVELIATRREGKEGKEGGEIMVLYEQGLARTCDVESRELRRSMSRETAGRVLQEGQGKEGEGGGWTVWFPLDGARGGGEVASSPTDPLLHLDLRLFLESAALQIPWSSSISKLKPSPLPSAPGTPDGSPDPSRKPANGVTSKDDRAAARQLIASLATFGLDRGADELLEALEVFPPTEREGTGLGDVVQNDGSVSIASLRNPSSAWTISPSATAQRLLRLVCLLRLFLNYPETERTASELIVYYASCLADSVGRGFASPSLEMLARFWLDRNPEVQQAARSLFGTYLATTRDEEVSEFVEQWQEKLPARQQGAGLLHQQADHALLVVGLVVVERFKLLSASVLKDVSDSISLYLDPSSPPYHQAISVSLCSLGFAIFQHYVDAPSLVRSLFSLAIGKNPATPNDLRLLARNATMHVAGVNTPLFMTTLLHDILNAKTGAERNATLKLLGFIIRKKPLVLYTSLPRVAEAVVKSLDPTVSSLRETVHQAATVILNELVRTFPSIDFHGKSQRLAVGTHEGACIVFDLRTATRLYVLEGHSHPVTALSWSPDGHRLVTVSLEESKVAVWKTATGLFSGMLAAGAVAVGAAAKGAAVGGAGGPWKSYDFHVGDEGMMTTAATLEWVVFDWPAERTVRLRLRETALNFGV